MFAVVLFFVVVVVWTYSEGESLGADVPKWMIWAKEQQWWMSVFHASKESEVADANDSGLGPQVAKRCGGVVHPSPTGSEETNPLVFCYKWKITS